MFNNGFHNRLIESITTPFLSPFCPLDNPLFRLLQDLSYALSVGKIRARSVYQTELAAQVSPPIKPEIAQLPFVLWLLYWMPGWIWDLFYCLTGGMSHPQYVRLVITKFITLIIVSLLIFGLQTLIYLPNEQRYQQELRRWRNTFVCADCGTCFVKR